MRFTVLRSKAVHVTDEHQLPLENYLPKTRQWDFKTQRYGPKYTVFLDFLSAQNGVQVISRVKISGNDLRGNKNHFELAGCSSYRGFELPRVKLENL